MKREKVVIWGMILGMVLLAIGTFAMAHFATTEYREAVSRTPSGGATRTVN